MARQRQKKLAEIVEAPRPSAAVADQARASGAKVLSHDPARLREFVEGRITLGELERIGKDAQYRMAKIGFDFMNSGKLENARRVFLGLLALDPYDAYFHLALGAIHQREGDLAAADERYTRSLEINPFSAVALANRGEARLVAGRVEEGVRDLAAALQRDPQAREPAVARGRAILASLGRQLQEMSSSPRQATDGAAVVTPTPAPACAHAAAAAKPAKERV